MPHLEVSPELNDPVAPPAPRLCRFTVRAVADPSVLSRVVELFALRDMLPERVHFERAHGGDELRIDLDVTGLDAQEADHVARRMRTFPTVIGVLLQRD